MKTTKRLNIQTDDILQQNSDPQTLQQPVQETKPQPLQS